MQPPIDDWSLFRARLVWAYDAFLAPGRWSRAYVPHPVGAWLIRRGSITLHFRDETRRFGPGEWIFPREAEGVQECGPEGVALLSLRFYAEWPCGTPLFDRSRTVTVAGDSALTREAKALVRFARRRLSVKSPSRALHGGFAEYLGLQPLFARWLVAYHAALEARGVPCNRREGLPPQVSRTLQSLEERPLSHPAPEGELAREAGCSLSHLNRLFVRHTGGTPAALWRRRRLNAAKAGLLHGGESVKAIAYRLGFSAPEHFTHWFRKATGLTPTAFRKTSGGGPPV